MKYLSVVFALALGACGSAYVTPKVKTDSADVPVRIVALSGETVLQANQSTYRPKTLPAAFFQNAGAGGAGIGAGALPRGALTEPAPRAALQLRVPPPVPARNYEIGVGDVILLATPSSGTTVEELSGLLAAQNRRQGYTVRDDGAIAIPDVGRIEVNGLTLQQAEEVIFERLVERQIDPTFSIEIAEFNSQRVSIGGAVAKPSVVSIRLTPLTLDEAIAAAGGIDAPDLEFASVRIYRDGTLYQIPLEDLYSNRNLLKTQLAAGDSVFVDTSFDLERAEAYFDQQITLTGLRNQARRDRLTALQTEVNLRRSALQEQRSNFQARLDLGAVDVDYVYLTGEVANPSRFEMPFGQQATLADALFASGGFDNRTANPSQIYVLRGNPDPSAFSAVTAWHLDGENPVNMILATRLELRPNDIIFIAEQPVTRWNRVVQQITPSLINAGVRATN
ncbi:polysaccharide biosynthesis/export family protein [Nereida sp. MMG025]|uniref:polysaccharide biosynthesis/export family protein n=1 Tax=Nereida sp. MMG025 TaxID=2909981 RepID=UPI001EFFEEA6|nr:polysaccharide biosynthesis/export family protein [Nereida sp. MMG025]MCF6445773.1 polysaccharide biosynthesis/export family protein [Nereida sp. MMG025]